MKTMVLKLVIIDIVVLKLMYVYIFLNSLSKWIPKVKCIITSFNNVL